MLCRDPGPLAGQVRRGGHYPGLLEEAVTTALTNAAPLLGSELGKAMITASTNYLEVVFRNSVWPVFVPWILAWTVLLNRYDFPPNHVFLLFGLTGTLAETHFGIGAVIAGFWFFVYGLMVYRARLRPPGQEDRPRAMVALRARAGHAHPLHGTLGTSLRLDKPTEAKERLSLVFCLVY